MYDPQLMPRGMECDVQHHAASEWKTRGSSVQLSVHHFSPQRWVLLGSFGTKRRRHTRRLRALVLSSGFSVGGPETPMGRQSWLEPWRTLTLRKKATVPETKRSKELH